MDFETAFTGTVRQWLPYGPVLAFTSIYMAVKRPFWRAPNFTFILNGCRVLDAIKSSSRVYRNNIDRPVIQVRYAATSSSSTSCLEPKPPPTRSLMTLILFSLISRARATVLLIHQGVWVEAWIISRSPSILV